MLKYNCLLGNLEKRPPEGSHRDQISEYKEGLN
jgi:hypothetical protein